MGTASGIFKQVTYKKEVVYGTVPVAAAAQAMRNVQSTLDMSKDTYQSNEKRSDFQVADFRHGLRKVAGAISGELSAKTYADFIAAILKKDFVAGVAVAGASVTIGGVAGAWTIGRAAGSFLTDGIKVGDVVRLTAGVFNAANLNKNILVTAVVAAQLTGVVLNASALVPEGPIAAATVAVFGKKSMIPQTGHTDNSYAVEHWFPEVPASEVFTGCKPTKISFGLPSTGMATISVEFAGKDAVPAGAQYFTNPTPLTTTGTMAAVNGVLRIANTVVANVTGLSIDMTSAQSGEAAVGSNTVAFQAPSKVVVTGQFTATFDSVALRDAFYNETEISLYAVFTSDNTAAADFVGFALSRMKLGGASKDDGDKTLIQTLPFQALLNLGGGAGKDTELTTIAIQDSAA